VNNTYVLTFNFGDAMRVITGTLKGKRLNTPEGRDIRPTPDRVKEGLFSALHFDIEGRRILDLFAGSGQLGIEALSRGAESCVFVDASKDAVKIIKSNLSVCGLEDKTKVFQSDFKSFCAMSRDTFDYVFLDPPYLEGLLTPAIKAVLPLMSDYGAIICEHPPEVKLEPEVGGFYIHKTYRYGKVIITVYRKGEP
jgi:16S rRNA (guanine(966)-N(2))-methyltransferase RsmD